MKIIAALSFYLLLLSTGPGWAGMYKCTDNGGRVTFQQELCADEASSESQIDLKINTPKKPFPLTKQNKAYFHYYTIHENQKVIVDGCNYRNSPYADDISRAHRRFYEIGESKIEKGREIAETGLVGLPSSEIRNIQRKGNADKKIELRGMSMDELNRLCRSHARKLRNLAGQIPDRSSGRV
jgi:hypothetical protein